MEKYASVCNTLYNNMYKTSEQSALADSLDDVILQIIRLCKSQQPVCVRYLLRLKQDTLGKDVRGEFTSNTAKCVVIDECTRWT